MKRALETALTANLIGIVAILAVTLALRWALVPVLAAGAAVCTLGALFMVRSGWIRPGIMLALISVGYMVMHAAAAKDGIRSIGFAVIPVLIIIASVLLDRLLLILFTAGAILSTFVVVVFNHQWLNRGQSGTKDIGDTFIFCVTCIAAAVISRVFAERMREGYSLLQASEARYRHIFGNIQDVYYEMKPDGTLIEASPAVEALLGTPRVELLGKTLAPTFIDRPAFDGFLTAFTPDGRVSNHELLIRRSNGVLVHGLVNALKVNAPETGEETIIGSIREITERRRAEAALRESEERLRLALDSTGIGTFDFYPGTGQLIWSDITKSHVGLSSQARPAGDLISAIHPEDRERLEEAALLLIQGQDDQLKTECRIIGIEDGKERWIAIHCRTLFEPRSSSTRVIGTTRDVTERKRLEEELRHRVEELQKVMDVAPVGLLVSADAECRSVIANRTAKQLLEVPADSGVTFSGPDGPTRPWRLFSSGVELAKEGWPLGRAARGEEVRNFELTLRLPDTPDKILAGNSSPLRDSQGRIRGAVLAFEDVTEVRRQAAEVLRESEDRFRTVADAAPVIVWFADTSQRLVFVNRSMIEFTGLPLEQLLGDNWKQVIHPEDRESSGAIWLDHVAHRRAYNLEYRARRTDGEYRHMLHSGSPRYVGSEYAGYVGTVLDVTELRQRQQEDFARNKLESVGLLARGIAHDFNNLLGSVLAQAELASSRLGSGAQPFEELARIGELARHGSEIAHQLIACAGDEAKASEIINVSQTVESMRGLLEASVVNKAALKVELDGQLPPVSASNAQIRQILLNLVSNAAEAVGAEGGVIRITTGRVLHGSIIDDPDLHSLTERGCIELRVSDNGSGIAPGTRDRLFDPFFTTHSSRRGLGLSVVQGIARTVGGAVRVYSESGGGTTFSVFLPAAEQAVPDPVPVATVPAPPLPPATILLVEDEGMLRQPVALLLRKKGFTVLEASDGLEALQLIREHTVSIDVVLLDLTLPGASSREIFEEVLDLAPNAKVIVNSAYSAATAEKSLEARPDYFIRKPFRMAELLEMVRRSRGEDS